MQNSGAQLLKSLFSDSLQEKLHLAPGGISLLDDQTKPLGAWEGGSGQCSPTARCPPGWP